jgi:ZIP family zinc transporter
LLRTAVFALGASLPLLLGSVVGVLWRPPRVLLAVALAFAAGALISAVSFELFLDSYVFVVVDTLLDKRLEGGATAFALLAAVTLDGVPENAALGVSLVEGGSIALLVAVFASNFPEALAGAVSMREDGRSRRTILALWTGATVLLALAVVVGRVAFSGSGPAALSLPLAFAAGAVLASVVDTLAPKAFSDGGPYVALATAAGFFTAFLLSV